jgi:hypothetical protein
LGGSSQFFLRYHEEAIVKDNKDGTYIVFYNLMNEGEYVLNVTIRAVDIKDSPFVSVLLGFVSNYLCRKL